MDADENDPYPVCVEDVKSAKLSDELKQSIIAEGVGAAAFIPIMQDGRLTGKFMAYHGVPHCFSEPEIASSLLASRDWRGRKRAGPPSATRNNSQPSSNPPTMRSSAKISKESFSPGTTAPSDCSAIVRKKL